ncbi:MAG TPA: 23S rRNA (pseudouridine(1915)-N(3))-methyltransferase RlmH [Paralcaligenes sp.]
MKLLVIAVGVRMPDWVETAWREYAKRLPSDCALELREIKPEPRTSGKTPAQMKLAEARRIEASIPAHARKIALDEHGRDMTTIDLTHELQAWRANGQDIAILVGGPDGLDDQLKESCHGRWRLSSLTLPHAMVRVIVAEQLYRAWAIMTRHPYHRA